ncbi:MAG TPA: DinB family protein [Streptosporangiaceae bacterium]|nr:DinB family protein [Streptosporangiaceae bacterium]
MTEDNAGEAVPERWSAAGNDMWMDMAQDPRFAAFVAGQELEGERATLLDYLRTYRLTLEMKCADLDAAQLARKSVPPSTMSLLGLVRHMADVERNWFRRVMAQADAPPLYWSDDDREGNWLGAVADPAVVDDAWRAWREEVAFAEKFVADSPDLGIKGVMRDGASVALREVLVHMIEEYARHCGHADLLRERIDGRVGQ